MLKTPSNPAGTPIEVFDQIRKSILTDRSQYWKDFSAPFYGANRPGAKVSQGLRDSFWLQGMMAGLNAEYDCVKAFSETDQTEDLKKFDVPTLILHGASAPSGQPWLKRRSDRADRSLGSLVVEARKGINVEDNPRRPARDGLNLEGPNQCRIARLL